jgi:hypothetical protein
MGIVVLIAGLLLAAAASPPADGLELERLDKAAACLIRKDRVAVAHWAATDPGSAEEASRREKLSPLIATCAAGLAAEQVADAAAIRLFNRYSTRRISLPGSAEESNLFANAVLQGAGKLPRKLGVLRCVALMHPEVSEAFVRTKFKSRREARSLRPVLTAIAACTPAGERLLWTNFTLRLGLARQVYKMSPASQLARGMMGAEMERAIRTR